MALEIERKFLVTGDYKSLATSHSRIVQGYICSERGRTVRVRLRDERGYITIKAARRIISYRGYFSHTDSVGISAKLHIVEVSRAASNVISAAARAELAAAA